MESSSISVVETSSVCSGSVSVGVNTEVMVNTALLARIELLEAENEKLIKEIHHSKSIKREPFSIKHIACNNALTKSYTGFPSYEVFLAFYDFLGPSVDGLTYWGEKTTNKQRHGHRKVESIDQFCLL